MALKSKLFTPIFHGDHKHAVGLAMADSSLELVNLVEEKHGLGIDYFKRISLGTETVVRGYIRKSDEFVQAVTSLVADLRREKQAVTVATALPDYQVFTRVMKFAPDQYNKDTVIEDIRREVRLALPLDLDEVIIRALRNDVADGSKEILIFVTHKSLISNWVENFTKAGISLAVIEMESLSLIRSLIKECPLESSIFIADLGGSSSDLSIVDCDGIKLSASVSVGGKRYTQIIARELQLSTDEAEKQKCSIGLTGAGHSPVSLVLEREVKLLADKINDEIRFYEQGNKPVAKIIVVGGTAAMPGLFEFLSKTCGRPCELGHPWVNIESKIVDSFSLARKHLPVNQEYFYGSATGLAMRGLNRGNLRAGINFLE